MLQENCYVISDDTKECVICDCGAYSQHERQSIIDYIKEQQLKPVHLIATHGHIDHNFGNNTIYEQYGLMPEVHKEDEQLMEMLDKQAEGLVNVTLDYQMPNPMYFDENHVIRFGTHEFTIGRTDFIGGSMFQIIQSLRMICQLPDTTKIYPGHGETTTIGNELASNPYLDR